MVEIVLIYGKIIDNERNNEQRTNYKKVYGTEI